MTDQIERIKREFIEAFNNSEFEHPYNSDIGMDGYTYQDVTTSSKITMADLERDLSALKYLDDNPPKMPKYLRVNKKTYKQLIKEFKPARVDSTGSPFKVLHGLEIRVKPYSRKSVFVY